MSRSLVVVGLLLAIAAAFVDPDALADSAFRGSWFFSRPMLGDLRLAAVLLGASLAGLPWVLAVLRRPETVPDGAARGWRRGDLLFVAALLLATLWVWVRLDPVVSDSKGYLG